MSIINKIIHIMNNKNLNANNLCKSLCISPSTFSRWKSRNTDPPAKYILGICEFLEVPVECLLDSTYDISDISIDYSMCGESRDSSNYDKTVQQLAEVFSSLDFIGKTEVMDFIVDAIGRQRERDKSKTC